MNLTISESLVLAALRSLGDCWRGTHQDLADAAGVPLRSCERATAGLRALGVIERLGQRGNPAKWRWLRALTATRHGPLPIETMNKHRNGAEMHRNRRKRWGWVNPHYAPEVTPEMVDEVLERCEQLKIQPPKKALQGIQTIRRWAWRAGIATHDWSGFIAKQIPNFRRREKLRRLSLSSIQAATCPT